MSLETWKHEFYPIDAKNVPEKDALAHSLQKWIGLRPDNLRKHGVKKWSDCIEYVGDYLDINSATCALCVHHCVGDGVCTNCPLYKTRGGKRCDEGSEVLPASPYDEFVDNGNAEPMINLIKLAISQSK